MTFRLLTRSFRNQKPEELSKLSMPFGPTVDCVEDCAASDNIIFVRSVPDALCCWLMRAGSSWTHVTGKKGHGDAAVTTLLPVTSSSSTDLLVAQWCHGKATVSFMNYKNTLWSILGMITWLKFKKHPIKQHQICICVGPFWICVTLVFSVAIGGNLSTFLSERGNPLYHYRPQFHRGPS